MKNSKQKLFKSALVIILSLFIFSCSKDDDSTAPIVSNATSLELVSGQNQENFIGRTLANSIEVIVKNQNGDPFAGDTVSFSVDEGTLSAQTLVTNAEGKAFVNWTLGETIGDQVLTITSFVNGGTPLSGSPLTVSATGLDPCITESNTTAQPIGPDAGTETSSQISIFESFSIADVNVTINLVHTYDADLEISLIAPTGLVINLSSDNGEFGDNYTNTIFDDDAETLIIDGAAPFTGSFQPEEPLSSFNGTDSKGVWTLFILDDQNSDQGFLLSWSIELCQ